MHSELPFLMIDFNIKKVFCSQKSHQMARVWGHASQSGVQNGLLIKKMTNNGSLSTHKWKNTYQGSVFNIVYVFIIDNIKDNRI